jgi:signal transduction histidine kinase
VNLGGKIRLLLLILGICCIGTAISLKHAITKKDLLRHEASILQKNLHINERIAHNFLSDPEKVEKTRQFHLDEDFALEFLDTYRNKGINILTYEDSELKFWSSFRTFPPNPASIKDGTTFAQFANGWYEMIKKSFGNYTVIFLIDIKNQYPIENQYLKNRIVPNLSPDNSLNLASFSDEEVAGIHNIEGKLMFEVKLKPGYSKSLFATLEIWLWIIGIFSICLFVNSFCSWLARNGRLILATLVIFLFFLAVRLTDLQFGWFNHEFDLSIFKPTIYAASFFLPSLGDFLLNVIALTWVVLFIYTHKEKYVLSDWVTKSKAAGLALHALLLLVFTALAFLFEQVFFGLIYNSKINFDITNIINLDWLSWISIIILCLVWFNVFLILSILMQITLQTNVTNKERLRLFLVLFGAFFLYRIFTEFTIFFIAYSLFIFILGWNIYRQQHKFSIGIFASLFFCLAFISSIKYQKYSDVKERNSRSNLIQKMRSSDDPKVISSIGTLEQGIAQDGFIENYFKKPALSRLHVLENYISKKYLDGYLSHFDYQLHFYNHLDSSFRHKNPTPLGKYKQLVRSGSVKTMTSDYFYRVNDAFGYQNYFGIIPIMTGSTILGTLVIELKSQQFNYNSQFPELLIDGKLNSDEDYNKYSFAFYQNDKLEKQSGKFTYKLSNTQYKADVDKLVFINDKEEGYSHLVYRPSVTKTIVVSKEKISYVVRLAALSFFFLVFILFSVSLYALVWLIKNIDENWGGWFNINRSLMINANKILYKTRIQFSIVLSVVATLLIVGWTTFFYISDEYRKQQEDFIREKMRKVQVSYERQVETSGIPERTDQAIVDFNQFADINATFLNLFDTSGNLIFTSLPKIYDYGIIGKKMSSRAFVYLDYLQRSEYLNPNERIGSFLYASAYAPVRDSRNKIIAYIGLPYYANEEDYQTKIGLFINTLINIYALVFVAIGILAVFLANQITSPLTFIQDSIRKTKLGQRNQPIQWSRHDEIGSLIKEYNKMIAALEDSAIKLARSERESAWREMAKQVAHEIKNPLTPLKLGVQLLEKAWKEKDENFEKKFERFNRSFIEQIDSLSTIASEFSNFAKMPDTKLERLQIIPVIEQTREVFIHTHNAEIYINNETRQAVYIMGDKDQLLRTFNNLLKNAIEACRPGINCVIAIRILTDDNRVWIEVADNGKGIDEELQEKIFVPNFTTKSSGTGLGLAFVKQAVENAGGSIDFKSVVGQGTKFYLSFPLS